MARIIKQCPYVGKSAELRTFDEETKAGYFRLLLVHSYAAHGLEKYAQPGHMYSIRNISPGQDVQSKGDIISREGKSYE
jgi:hypothetical protein